MRSNKKVVDLTVSRFVSAGVVGVLYMTDGGQMLLNRGRQVVLHDLHVIDVVLERDVTRPSLVNDIHRL